jgi:mannose-1-phosphate guanylyltransferase
MSRAAVPSPRHAIILCAGVGERLRPLSEELPKPLVPVGDRSVLAHIAGHLSRAGYRSALANTHWMPEKFEAITGHLDLELTLIHEPEIRGQAGGIAGGRSLLEAPVVAWNGDILIDEPPLAELAARVAVTGGICLAVAPAAASGTVGLDSAGHLIRVRGQRHGVEVGSANYVGLLALGRKALAELPERGCLIDDFILPRLRRGDPAGRKSDRWMVTGRPTSTGCLTMQIMMSTPTCIQVPASRRVYSSSPAWWARTRASMAWAA